MNQSFHVDFNHLQSSTNKSPISLILMNWSSSSIHIRNRMTDADTWSIIHQKRQQLKTQARVSQVYEPSFKNSATISKGHRTAGGRAGESTSHTLVWWERYPIKNEGTHICNITFPKIKNVKYADRMGTCKLVSCFHLFFIYIRRTFETPVNVTLIPSHKTLVFRQRTWRCKLPNPSSGEPICQHFLEATPLSSNWKLLQKMHRRSAHKPKTVRPNTPDAFKAHVLQNPISSRTGTELSATTRRIRWRRPSSLYLLQKMHI